MCCGRKNNVADTCHHILGTRQHVAVHTTLNCEDCFTEMLSGAAGRFLKWYPKVGDLGTEVTQ